MIAENLAGSPSEVQRQAAESLLKGLLKLRSASGMWHSREGGEESLSATVWASLALRSSLKAGLSVDGKLLESIRQSVKAGEKNRLESTLVSLLSDQKLDPTETEQLKKQLLASDWKSHYGNQPEATLFALIALRKIDDAAFKEFASRNVLNLDSAQ